MPCRNNRVCMEKMMADQRKPQRDAAWITAGGVAIAGDAILLDLKLGADNGFLDALIWRKAAASVAAKRGVSLSDDDLVEALDSFHADRDLFEPEQIDHWYETVRLKDAGCLGCVHAREIGNFGVPRDPALSDE